MGGSPKGGTGRGMPIGGYPGFNGKTLESFICVRRTDTLTVGTLSVEFGVVDRPLTINPDNVTAMSGRKEKRTTSAVASRALLSNLRLTTPGVEVSALDRGSAHWTESGKKAKTFGLYVTLNLMESAGLLN